MVKCYSQSSNNIITQIDDDKLPKNFDSWEWIVDWWGNSFNFFMCFKEALLHFLILFIHNKKFGN